MSDFRLWWALFVFFAVLSVLVVQRRYRHWQQARSALPLLSPAERDLVSRRIKLEGWRLALMVGSILAMTAVVFGVFLGAPPALLNVLRSVAVAGVLGVLILGILR